MIEGLIADGLTAPETDQPPFALYKIAWIVHYLRQRNDEINSWGRNAGGLVCWEPALQASNASRTGRTPQTQMAEARVQFGQRPPTTRGPPAKYSGLAPAQAPAKFIHFVGRLEERDDPLAIILPLCRHNKNRCRFLSIVHRAAAAGCWLLTTVEYGECHCLQSKHARKAFLRTSHQWKRLLILFLYRTKLYENGKTEFCNPRCTYTPYNWEENDRKRSAASDNSSSTLLQQTRKWGNNKETT